MKIVHDTDRQAWNARVQKAHASFLQSYEWALFQRHLGRTVFFAEGIAGASIIIQLPVIGPFSYWYLPRSPIIFQAGQEDVFFDEVRAHIHPSVIFIRTEPHIGIPHTARLSLPVQPQAVRVIECQYSDSELRARMHQKTRYNIGLAERKGVVIQEGGTVEHFVRLLRETTTRNQFHGHPDTYYKELVSFFSKNLLQDGGQVLHVYEALYQGVVVAAILVLVSGDTAVYLHGASSDQYRDCMAPYLVHFYALQKAREAGCQRYDLGGVDVSGDPKHPFAGITRFKQGFGGTLVEYPGTFDIPIHVLIYTLYTLARRLRRAV